MGALRREVTSPVPAWRKPHTFAGLFFASLLFATSLDAMLISYRLRCAELERAVNRPEQARVEGMMELERVHHLVERARLELELVRADQALLDSQRALGVGLYQAQSGGGPDNTGELGCVVADPLCGI